MSDSENVQRLSGLGDLAEERSSPRRTPQQLTDDELARYRGKVLAVLAATGRVIAAADSAAELKAAVENSSYAGQFWRLVDGPTNDKPPMTVAEFLELHTK